MTEIRALSDADVDGVVALRLRAWAPVFTSFASALLAHCEDHLRAAGVVVVEVGSGADAEHAPARRLYETAGFTALPWSGTTSCSDVSAPVLW